MISRAYYAAFWEARVGLEAGGTAIDPARSVHQQIIDVFETLTGPNQREYREIASTLMSLRTERNAADYDASIGFSRDDAEFALTAAKRLIQKLQALR